MFNTRPDPGNRFGPGSPPGFVSCLHSDQRRSWCRPGSRPRVTRRCSEFPSLVTLVRDAGGTPGSSEFGSSPASHPCRPVTRARRYGTIPTSRITSLRCRCLPESPLEFTSTFAIINRNTLTNGAFPKANEEPFGHPDCDHHLTARAFRANQTRSGSATITLQRLGSLIPLYTHSRPTRCIHSGARRCRPASTSKVPPTPRQTMGVNLSRCAAIHSSCRGEPKATRSRWGRAV